MSIFHFVGKRLILSSALLLAGLSMAQAQYLDFRKYAWEIFDTATSEIPHNHVSELLVDGSNSIWVSTAGSHAFQILEGGRWEHVPANRWMTKSWLNSWEEINRGRFWIAGEFGYVLNYTSAYQKWDTLSVPGKQTRIVRGNDKGGILLGCNGPNNSPNLYQIINGRAISMTDRFEEVMSIFIEDNGNALVAFKKGLYRYRMRSDGTYRDDPKKLSDLAFYEVAVDGNGKIWATCYTDGYLHAYDNGGWYTYKGGPRELYVNYQGRETYVSYNLMILPDNRVLISTQYKPGIAVFDGEVWKEYIPPLKNQRDVIKRLALGPDGSIWCGTSENGLAVFRPASLIKPRPERKRYKDTLTKSQDSLPPMVLEPPVEGSSIPYIPDPTRKVRTNQHIAIFEDSIFLRIWDSQVVDGDTISLYLNGKPIHFYKELTAVQDTFWLQLKEGNNEILLYAHNLGRIPPNTVTMVILYGKKYLNVNLNSDLETCERILIRRRRRDGNGY